MSELRAVASEDSITSGDLNDTIFGNAGNNVIVFQKTGDIDTLRDFTEGAGAGDVIRLVGLGASFDSFAEVIAVASQSGADVVFTFGGGNTVTVVSATVAGFAANDFSFG